MSRRAARGFLLVLAAGWLRGLASHAHAEEAAETGTIVGVVEGPDGAGLQDVDVVAYDAENWSWHGQPITSAAGSFALELPPGAYKLHYEYTQWDDFTVEGIVGPETRAALASTPANARHAFHIISDYAPPLSRSRPRARAPAIMRVSLDQQWGTKRLHRAER
jgi:hypothetical protein